MDVDASYNIPDPFNIHMIPSFHNMEKALKVLNMSPIYNIKSISNLSKLTGA
jgi:hypothetical protein